MAPPTLSPAQIALQAERKAAKQAKKEAAKAQAKESGTVPIVITDAEQSRFLNREWVGVGRSQVGNNGGQAGADTGPSSRGVTRVVTWNILAQTLVRRELFPGSDCLRWAERRPMLLAELASYAPSDFICLQECDRLDDLAPALPHHRHVSTKGRGKLHGLMVFYNGQRFRLRAERTVYLDEEDLSPSEPADDGQSSGSTGKHVDGDDGKRRRRGGSRQTKNVGLIAAFEEVQPENEAGNAPKRGVVIATTHLFWHPKFAYERVRQMIILLRAIRSFRIQHDCMAWPAVLAGDLNIQPYEATYQLLTSPRTPLHAHSIEHVNSSRLVHTSVDKITVSQDTPGASPSTQSSGTYVGPKSENESSAPRPSSNTTADDGDSNGSATKESNKTDSAGQTGTGSNTPIRPPATQDNKEDRDDEGEGEGGTGGEPDSSEKSIANTRPPEPADGILEVDELVRLFREALPQANGLQSAYGSSITDVESQTAAQSSNAAANRIENNGGQGGAMSEGLEGENGNNAVKSGTTNDVQPETFGKRGGLDVLGGQGEGRNEPRYTCYTPLFKLTLDYLFLHPPESPPSSDEASSQTSGINTSNEQSPPVEIVELLRPAHSSELGEGLPRKGISASDHLAVGVGLRW